MINEMNRRLQELKLNGMSACWSSMEETHQLDKLSLRDGMQLMVQSEWDQRQGKRISRLIKSASMRLNATLEQLEISSARGVPADLVTEMGTGNYIRNGRSVIITGPTGTGKSYLACAFGERACRQGYKVRYYTMNMLIETLKMVHLEGKETSFFRKMNNQDLVIIDDFGMLRLEKQLQHDFEQIVDDRYNRKALILASQLPVSDWYSIFQSELIAEACLDRLAHKSIRYSLSGDSMRKKY